MLIIKMKRIFYIIGVMQLLALVQTNSYAQGLSPKKIADIFPDSVKWMSFPAFPKEVKLAVLIGNPSKAEEFIVRVKVPAGAKIMPHVHPEDRIYTVISGVFYIGFGNKFDETRLKAYPPGSIIVLPGNTPHFHWAKSGEYVTQVSAMGPLGLEYVNSTDDPRKK